MMDTLTIAEWELLFTGAGVAVLVVIAGLLTYQIAAYAHAPSEPGDTTTPDSGPNRLVRLLHSEPALVAGFVSAAAALAASWGFEFSAEQTGTVVAFTSIVLGLWVRASVYSSATVAASGLAYDEGDGTLKRRVR